MSKHLHLNSKVLLCTLLAFSITLGLAAQTEFETVVVPLTNPGETGSLFLHIHQGNITVIGENRSDVEVKFSKEPEDSDLEQRGTLKRILASAVSIDIRERNNEINIDADQKRTNYVVTVPQNFNLSLRSHHDADIVVRDVSGEFEIQSHHGSIELHEVSGSASAETHHGRILASFRDIDSDGSMAFTTYHGDVEVTLPGSTKCSAKMKPGRGEIFTDFDLQILPSERAERNEDGTRHIKVGGWIRGEIGGGGSEYLFATHHGDIILRKG